MSGPKRDLDKWRDAVLKHPEISDACRVLLLVLADNMTADLKVSVSRAELARKLNRSERRIGDRFREAVGEKPEADPGKARRNREARLLDRIVRGQKNTARSVYQGLMPDQVNRTHGGPVENTGQQDTYQPVENVDKCPVENQGNRVPAPSLESQQDTRGSCLIRDSPLARGADRNKRSNEEHEPPEADDEPTAGDGSPCPHGMPDGDLPDAWLPGNRLACPACARTAADRKKDA